MISLERQTKDFQQLYWACYPCDQGIVALASTDNDELCFLGFCDEKETLEELMSRFPKATLEQKKCTVHQKVLAYFYEEKEDEDLKLLVKGTDFQWEVWNALLSIPKGEKVSYAHVSEQINRPKAFRAVGTAIGKNPISLLIPCHRVLQTGGKLGGYAWGLEIKQSILGWEAK
ncbi:MAG: methylated-DNA--[protein]-cysteine S-methyltransferase [Cytophagales bacterium]|nr:methylated-DNA--[protein]-cysteine S-methyltransferase [Cytophagales bacterium]